MIDEPRLVELYGCMCRYMSDLCTWSSHEGLRTFCELNQIRGVSVETRDNLATVNLDYDSDVGADVGLCLIVKYGSDEEASSPMDEKALRWLERHFGAVLRWAEADGHYAFYRMYEPTGKRYTELYPKLVANPWRHCEVVWGEQ